MPRLRVLVVDDEPLARRGIIEMLRRLRVDNVDIIEARNGTEAVNCITSMSPDIVFLDIQMPGLDGFDVIESVGASAMPPVIFVTAYDQHALKAFEVHPVDYLLKPLDPDRFADAFDRACRAKGAGELTERRHQLSMAASSMRSAVDRRIMVRDNGRIIFIRRDEMSWIESQGNYVKIHAGGATVTHRSTLDDFHALLGPGFMRIRRSALVRKEAVRVCESLGNGAYAMTLSDKTRLTSSRYYRDQLASLIDE